MSSKITLTEKRERYIKKKRANDIYYINIISIFYLIFHFFLFTYYSINFIYLLFIYLAICKLNSIILKFM